MAFPESLRERDAGRRNVRQWLALALIGLGLGVSVARVLFELNPLAFGLFGEALPATALAVVTAALLVLQGRTWTRWLVRLHAQRDLGPPDPHALGARDILDHLPLLLALLAVATTQTNPLRGAILLGGSLGGWLSLRVATLVERQLWPRAWIGFGLPFMLFALPLGLYLQTLAPTVGQADTFEFQVNVIRLGISHGSGYPLYMLLAKLFSWLPVGGTAAFRINLSSATFGALAVVTTYALGVQLKVARGAAALSALALGVTIGLWSRAVEAEVYTLNVFLVGLILWFLLRIVEAVSTAAADASSSTAVTARNMPRLAALVPLLGLTVGLSFANHLTTALLLPAILLGLVVARPRVTPSTWLFGLGLLALGLALYLYLPIRWPAVNNGELMTLDRFLRFVSGQEAHGAVRPWAFVQDSGRYAVVGRKVLDQYGWPGVALGLIGLVALARRNGPAAAITCLAYAGYGYFALSFYVPDPDFSSFLLPVHLIQAVWIAVGLDVCQQKVRYVIGNFRRRPLAATLNQAVPITAYTLFAWLPLSVMWGNYALVDKSDEWAAYDLGHQMLAQPLQVGATVLADSEKIAPLYYLQIAEGIRPDLDVVVLPTEDVYRAELDARVAAGQTVYLGRYLPQLAGAYYLDSYGPLTEASPTPGTSPPLPLTAETSVQFGEQIRLVGFAFDSERVAAGQAVRVTLVWQALVAPDGNYLVTFRLLDAAGDVAWRWPGNVPVGQMYPTAAWPPDEIISDYHALPLDRALPPGAYRLQVGLYPPFSESGLAVAPGQSWTTLTAVTVLPPTRPPAIGHPLRARLGQDLWLLGYELPAATAPAAPVQLTLHWQFANPPDAPMAIELRDVEGLREKLIIPADTYPPGQVFSTRAVLTAPDTGRRFELFVARVDQPARCGWLARSAPACPLPGVRLDHRALAPGAINFDNQLVLRQAALLTPTVRPGDTVVVTADWQSLRTMTEDYTVFVHLLGPDGLVHGQVDVWPAQGTLPTTRWQPGQSVSERYEVYLPADSPPGNYQVEVGWYLLASLDRLPVLDTDGRAVDDRHILEGLLVVSR